MHWGLCAHRKSTRAPLHILSASMANPPTGLGFRSLAQSFRSWPRLHRNKPYGCRTGFSSVTDFARDLILCNPFSLSEFKITDVGLGIGRGREAAAHSHQRARVSR